MGNCNSCPSKNSCSSQSTCNIKNNPNNKIGKIIGVMSGKGGVGKSTMTALIAKKLNKIGYKVGILDADITGPSIPRLMGVRNGKAFQGENGIIPVENSNGIKIMSINLMTDDESQPVVWRGPMVGNVVKQFYSDVLWEELDAMMNIKVLGVVENMSYIQCPDCDKKIKLFDGVETERFLKGMELDLLGELPMTREIVDITHNGVEEVSNELDTVLNNIVNKIK